MRVTGKFIFKVNVIIFPYLLAFTLFQGLVEAYKYSGFFQKHFFLNFLTFVNLIFFSGILIILSSLLLKTHLNRSCQKLFNFNSIFLPLFFIFTILINNIEGVKGNGYIFSILHLHPQNLIQLLMLSALVFFISLLTSGDGVKKAAYFGKLSKSTL